MAITSLVSNASRVLRNNTSWFRTGRRELTSLRGKGTQSANSMAENMLVTYLSPFKEPEVISVA
jgi:hypothetical protein